MEPVLSGEEGRVGPVRISPSKARTMIAHRNGTYQSGPTVR